MAASSVEKLQHFVNQPAHYQQRWARHDTAFWLKFVVREWVPLLNLHDRDTNTHLDYIYVDLLKLVAGKKFGKLHKYVSAVLQLLQADGELSSQDGKLLEGLFGANCKEAAPWWLNLCLALHVEACEALLELLDAEEPLLMLEVPQVWSQPAEHARPFEAFLRSRWGEELPDLLTVPKSELSWWTKPMAASKPPARDCPAPRGYWVCPRGPEGVETWLQRYQPPMTQGTYKKGPPLEGRKKLLWQVLELSIPPVWSRKFHLCDSWQLTKGLTNFEALDSCPWIVNWLQAFDLDYMHILQKNCKKRVIFEYGKTIKKMLALPNAPRDLEAQADFLLEPTLLLQLPWSAALFQQWLAGALLEVTRFEALSMELRHWPMDQDVLPAASRLLGLVARCKERLLLGLALLTRDITTYPTLYPETPGLILHKVVMPAVSVLRFLLHGKAYSILRQLKQRAFSQSTRPCDVTDRPALMCVNNDTYNMRPELLEFYVSHYFHVFYWMRDSPSQPFSGVFRDMSELAARVTNLPTNYPLCVSPTFYIPLPIKDFQEACMSNDNQTFMEVCMTSDSDFKKFCRTVKLVEEVTEDKIKESLNAARKDEGVNELVQQFATALRATGRPSLLRALVLMSAEALAREHEVLMVKNSYVNEEITSFTLPQATTTTVEDRQYSLNQIATILKEAFNRFKPEEEVEPVICNMWCRENLIPPSWLEAYNSEDFSRLVERTINTTGTNKKLLCQSFDRFAGMTMIGNFSVMQVVFKTQNGCCPAFAIPYMFLDLPLRFCVPALSGEEPKQSLARKCISTSLQFQYCSVCILSAMPQNNFKRSLTSAGPDNLHRHATLRDVFTFRQDCLINPLRFMADVCDVPTDSHTQGLRGWMDCVDQIHNEVDVLVCKAGSDTLALTHQLTDQMFKSGMNFHSQSKWGKLADRHGILLHFINLVAYLAAFDPKFSELKSVKLLLQIQPTLLKINSLFLSHFFHSHAKLPQDTGVARTPPATTVQRLKSVGQLRAVHSAVLELMLAWRRTIPGAIQHLQGILAEIDINSENTAAFFLTSQYYETMFDKFGLSPCSTPRAEQYLEKLSSIVEEQEGEKVLDLDPEGMFEKRECALCKQFKERALGIVKEQVFFCGARCEELWKIQDEEKVEKRRCEQCQKEETAGSKFHTEKFCSKKCQNDWKTAHECRCCKEEVSPELRLVGAVVLCSARCQVRWIQEQQADSKVKRCGLCRRSREGSEGFLPCGGRVFCGSHCRDRWRANGGRPYESGLLDCSYCGKRERKDEQFSLCPACVSDPQFPRPEVYCSQACRQIWWDQEHQPQHLEFELGLGDFCTPE